MSVCRRSVRVCSKAAGHSPVIDFGGVEGGTRGVDQRSRSRQSQCWNREGRPVKHVLRRVVNGHDCCLAPLQGWPLGGCRQAPVPTQDGTLPTMQSAIDKCCRCGQKVSRIRGREVRLLGEFKGRAKSAMEVDVHEVSASETLRPESVNLTCTRRGLRLARIRLLLIRVLSRSGLKIFKQLCFRAWTGQASIPC